MTSARTGADLEGLGKFAESTDRAEAMFFVGRRREIEGIEGACARAFESVMEGRKPEGETRIVQGAPGAGKTALLSRLGRIWDVDEAAPDHVLLDLGILDSKAGLAKAIIDARDLLDPEVVSGSIDAGKSREFQRTRTTDMRGRGGAPGVVGGEIGRVTITAPPEYSLDMVGRLFPPHLWERPLCLMFDEAHDITEAQVRVLRPLHLGTHRVPAVPVLAGLGNTRENAEKRGLSRIADGADCTLGPLLTDEAAEAVEMFLDWFDVDRSVANIDWPTELAKRSDGWPQHLHTAMQALSRGLLAADGRLADVDGAAVLQDARGRREAYYRRRTSTEMRFSRELVMSMMKALPENGLRSSEVIDLIEKTANAEGSSGERLPEGMTAKGFLDHLIGKGTLQLNESDRLACPTPSFHDFLARGFEMAPT